MRKKILFPNKKRISGQEHPIQGAFFSPKKIAENVVTFSYIIRLIYKITEGGERKN